MDIQQRFWNVDTFGTKGMHKVGNHAECIEESNSAKDEEGG